MFGWEVSTRDIGMNECWEATYVLQIFPIPKNVSRINRRWWKSHPLITPTRIRGDDVKLIWNDMNWELVELMKPLLPCTFKATMMAPENFQGATRRFNVKRNKYKPRQSDVENDRKKGVVLARLNRFCFSGFVSIFWYMFCRFHLFMDISNVIMCVLGMKSCHGM